MKTIGLIGGLSWHSTVEYYSYINQMVNDCFDSNTNPPLLIFNVNQRQIHAYQQSDQWDCVAAVLTKSALNLQSGGAHAILFCANTAHKVYEQVKAKISIPILHIADATGESIINRKIKKVGLLGTIYTMEEDYISGRINLKFAIDVLTPDDKIARVELQRIIIEELSIGIIKASSKKYLLKEIDLLQKMGAEGIILGCTELPLIIKDSDVNIPLFNSTLLHCKMAVKFCIGDD